MLNENLNLKIKYRLKLIFEMRGAICRKRECIIYGAKHHKDNQLQSLERPLRIS